MEKNPPPYLIDMETAQNAGRVIYGNHTTHIRVQEGG
jgi:hypothetical protein